MCGGTSFCRTRSGAAMGLSPRVRGNLLNAGAAHSQDRSIPACAGEPCSVRDSLCRRWVYPRVCGGTSSSGPTGTAPAGLSPRVRGNPPAVHPAMAGGRSIPACAGEPSASPPDSPPPAVYPRVCGGTTNGPPAAPISRGLSPRVRGNRPGASSAPTAAGSIPACAGEPGRRRRLRAR